MVLPEVLIGSEHGQMNDLAPGNKGNATGHQVVWQAINHSAARALAETVELGDLWENVVQAHEGAALELGEVLAIGRAALHEDDQRVVQVCLLALFDSVTDLLLHQLFVVFAVSIDNEALRGSYQLPNGVILGHLEFGDEA